MKRLLFWGWLSLLLNSCEDSEPAPPNIIFIIGDDISWDDIGCYGNMAIRTPNIDRMAVEGLRFSNFYLTASSCSPSRTSILTGRYPHNTGAAELHSPLPQHLIYFPELLKQHGYYTALAGKFHEGEHTRRAYDTLLTNGKRNGEGGEAQWVNLLKIRDAEKPFFFWLAANDAHRAWSNDTAFQLPYLPDEVMVPPTLYDDEQTRIDLASYYNEISRLDFYIGKLEQELKRQGIYENTIMVFISDNGRAFPGSKTLLYDRGIKSPFVIRWPKGTFNQGRVANALVSSIDIASTFLELAGITPGETFQGKSFVPLLHDPESSFRNYVFAEHNWHDYEACERSVRSGDYLYIRNYRPQFSHAGAIDVKTSPSASSLAKAKEQGVLNAFQNEVFVTPRPLEEFFHCPSDSLQANNLANDSTYREKMLELKNVLIQWQLETGDTIPDTLTADWYQRNTGSALPEKGKRGEMPGFKKDADRINHKGPGFSTFLTTSPAINRKQSSSPKHP